MHVTIDADWAVALYCQRCGKLHIHDFSYFMPMNKSIVLSCSCGHHKAILQRTMLNQVLLKIPCVVCDSVHQAVFSIKSLIRMKTEKIYCAKDHFELGYIGKRSRIEEMISFNKQVFASLEHDEAIEPIEKQQILLEVLNSLHDIAERGNISCACGGTAISADIVGNYVVLECCTCGNYHILSASTEEDIEWLQQHPQIELSQGRFLIKNIDLN